MMNSSQFTRSARLILAYRASASLNVPPDTEPYGTLDRMKVSQRCGMIVVGSGANEVETALEQLSPTASLIRNARLNW